MSNNHMQAPPAARLFTPDSVFWRVHREILAGLSGGRALALELAHPLIAAGVAEHSHFQTNPWRRLYRTVKVMNDLTFGGAAAARTALQHFHQCHARVRGVLPRTEGAFPAATKYSSQNPGLRFWVLATLIDSSLVAYEHFVAPLTLAEKRAYYLDSQRLAQAFGIPFSFVPDTYEEFSSYMQNMFVGEALHVGETAQALVQALLARRGLHGIARMMQFCGAAMLPEKLREAYDIAWDEKRERKFERIAHYCRYARARLPEVFCVNPQAWLAEWRFRQTEYDPPKVLQPS
ncbi:MAG: oxygenase MpaB family protein [bacterium]